MDLDNPEEGANSVHGKLMQGEEETQENGKLDRKKKGSNGLLDYKIDVYIRRHSLRGDTSSVKRYRTDMRKCCLCGLLLLIGLVAIPVAAYFLVNLHLNSIPPEVKTLNGVVRGRKASAPQGGEIEEFLGIPFAKPPLDDLRYADPEPIGKFAHDPYDATNVRYSCMQFRDTTFGDFAGSNMWNAPNPIQEDCLYLNIWVPRPKKEKRTVLVWIYGGGFFSGSNALRVYDGKTLAAHTDAIVCSFNYRVGTFGYLSTGDDRIKGNFGMKDQVLALKWIRDNIAAFGGDPDEVTIFGESSGASSAGLHYMSTHSDNLFKRGIFESGSPDCHWSFMTQKTARTRSTQLFEAVGCADDDDVLECMRNLPAMYILEKEWVDGNFMVFPWATTVDGDFLTDTPYNLLKAGKFQNKDALLGVNKDEGTYWLLYALPGFTKDGPSLHNHSMFLDGVDQVDYDLSAGDRERVKNLYAPANRDDHAAHRDALDKVAGDRSFTCPTKELTDIFAERGLKTYFYYLTHRSSVEVWPDWMGVIHGAEIPWVFGSPLNQSLGYTPDEVEFSKTIMSYWVNFARTGDPNGDGLPHWPQYTTENKKYVEWKSPTSFTENTTLREKYCDFWSEINSKFNKVGS